MSFIQDRRDDPVDTHHGIYNTIDAGVSLPVLGTSTISHACSCAIPPIIA
jgi:hypothetical protein